MAAELPNTVHSCSWHGMITAGLYSEWSDSCLSPSKRFTWCVHGFSPSGHY